MAVSCEPMSVGGDDTPETPDTNPSVDMSGARVVKSIEMKYVDNSAEPAATTSYTLYFTYNDEGKCTHIKVDYPSSDDLTCDITYGQNVIRFDVNGYHSPLKYVATLENGRAVSTTYGDESDNRIMTFDYDEAGYLSKITEWCPSHMENKDGCGYVAFKHEDGLCTGAYFDVHPESAADPEDAQIWSPNKWYYNGYSAYKTNIDLNSFVIDGGIEYDLQPWTLLNTLRYLGKVSDCLAERTYGFCTMSEAVIAPSGFDKPNTRYDMSYTTYREEHNDYPVTYTFDKDDFVQGFSYSKIFQKYRVDYYYQTTNEYLGDGMGYRYTRSDETYTKIGGYINCPVVLKVNY